MIAVYAPGSVSNVACGFDVLGFALDEPGDIVIAAQQDGSGVIDRRDSWRRWPAVDGSAKEYRVGGGARAVAAAGDDPRRLADHSQGTAARERHRQQRRQRRRRSRRRRTSCWAGRRRWSCCCECAMAGEQAGCGAIASRQRHTVVIRRFHPRAEREAARHRPLAGAGRPGVRGAASARGGRRPVRRGRLLGDQVKLKDATRQWANLGALVAALFTSRSGVAVAIARRCDRRAQARVARAGF